MAPAPDPVPPPGAKPAAKKKPPAEAVATHYLIDEVRAFLDPAEAPILAEMLKVPGANMHVWLQETLGRRENGEVLTEHSGAQEIAGPSYDPDKVDILVEQLLDMVRKTVDAAVRIGEQDSVGGDVRAIEALVGKERPGRFYATPERSRQLRTREPDPNPQLRWA